MTTTHAPLSHRSRGARRERRAPRTRHLVKELAIGAFVLLAAAVLFAASA